MPAARTIAAVAAMVSVVLASPASAHRLDEYLQAVRIAVEPDHLEIDLSMTPGVEVAAAIIGDIDRDRDGGLSAAEQQEFAARVLEALAVAHDGRAIAPSLLGVTFPEPDALRRGEATIRLRATAALPPHAAGDHSVTVRNDYRPDISVYLANALVPASTRVAVTAQLRDTRQRHFAIDYTLRDASLMSFTSYWVLGGLTVALAAVLRGRRSAAPSMVTGARHRHTPVSVVR